MVPQVSHLERLTNQITTRTECLLTTKHEMFGLTSTIVRVETVTS